MKFSIITCTYNSERYLGELISSVANQRHPDFEHIFIDGFSSDRTMDLIREYQVRFPGRVRVLQIPARGIADAMNAGIREASADYLIHLHSDDRFADPEVLSDAARFLDQNHLPDWIFGREVHRINKDRREIYPRFRLYTFDSRSEFGKKFLGLTNYIRHQTVFIKPEVFKKFGLFRTDLKCVMDIEMWLRIKDRTRWLFFDRIIDFYRYRDDAQSTSPANREANRAENLSVHREYLKGFSFLIYSLIDRALRLRSLVRLKK